MDDENKFEALEIIDKTEFEADEFPDEMKNKKDASMEVKNE